MKKKLLAVLLTAMLAVFVTACGSSEEADAAVTEAAEETIVAEEATEEAETETVVEEKEARAVETTEAVEETEAASEAEAELTGTLVFDVPEGFSESSEGVYNVEGKYSNINKMSLPNDGSFGMLTTEMLIETIEKQLEAQTETDVEITLVSDEYYEIDGREALKYEISYDINGITISQIQCIISDTEKLHFITYSDLAGEGYADAFKASLDSIRFE